MAINYEKQIYQDFPSTATLITKDRLNHTEDGVKAAADAADDINARLINTILNDPAKYCSAAVVYSLAQTVQTLNDNLLNFFSGYISTTDATWQTDILAYLKNTVKVNSTFKIMVAITIGAATYYGYVDGCKMNAYYILAEFKYSQTASPYYKGYRLALIEGVQFGWISI